jgi:hypothetical protein
MGVGLAERDQEICLTLVWSMRSSKSPVFLRWGRVLGQAVGHWAPRWYVEILRGGR